MKLHAKTKGNIGEMTIAKDLMLQNYAVFYELGDNSRIGLIAVKDDKLIKIQVKAYTSINGEYIEVRGTKSGPNYQFKYASTDINVFAIYMLDLDKIFYLSSKFLNEQNTITIRFKPSKNSQIKNVHYYEEFLSFEKL